jgi:hypothetical protein
LSSVAPPPPPRNRKQQILLIDLCLQGQFGNSSAPTRPAAACTRGTGAAFPHHSPRVWLGAGEVLGDPAGGEEKTEHQVQYLLGQY